MTVPYVVIKKIIAGKDPVTLCIRLALVCIFFCCVSATVTIVTTVTSIPHHSALCGPCNAHAQRIHFIRFFNGKEWRFTMVTVTLHQKHRVF